MVQTLIRVPSWSIYGNHTTQTRAVRLAVKQFQRYHKEWKVLLRHLLNLTKLLNIVICFIDGFIAVIVQHCYHTFHIVPMVYLDLQLLTLYCIEVSLCVIGLYLFICTPKITINSCRQVTSTACEFCASINVYCYITSVLGTIQSYFDLDWAYLQGCALQLCVEPARRLKYNRLATYQTHAGIVPCPF